MKTITEIKAIIRKEFENERGYAEDIKLIEIKKNSRMLFVEFEVARERFTYRSNAAEKIKCIRPFCLNWH